MSKRLRRTFAIVITIVTVALTSLVTDTVTATAADGTTVVPADPEVNASLRGKALFAPSGVSVTTSQSGLTVYATPSCSGFKACRSWFLVPGYGIDHMDVTTTGGYFVPWPSSWREGETVNSGYAHSFGRDLLGFGYYSNATSSLGSITRPYAERGITARLSSQNDSTRTAYVTGTATPGASIRRNNVVVATAAANGTWSATVGGLPIGTSTLTFQQYIGTTYRDQASVSVTFVAKDLLTGVTGETTTLAAGVGTLVYANLRATADITAPLTDAKVTFTAPEGTTFPADLTSVRGQYRAASGGDWQDFAADNLVDGAVSADGRTATFTWAPSSGTGWSLPNGTSIRFGITVLNPGAADSTGELRTTAAGSAPQGSFNTSATTPVRIEAGALDPVTVTGPATVSPGATNTLTGTATPGARFEVVDASGAVIVPGGPFTVRDDGTWSFTTTVPAGVTEFGFAIRQTANGKTETSEVFTIPADTFAKVTVATESVQDGVSNAFSGSATPDASYRVLNVSNNEIVTGGPFSIDADGHWQFDRVVSKGAKEFRFKLEQRKDGTTTTSSLFTIPAG